MSMGAHILVGCGGSGLKTLARVNELLSEDQAWRRRAPSDIYYVVVDTDAAEIREFERQVNASFQGMSRAPYVATFSLARDETTLQPLVQRYFIDPYKNNPDDPGLNAFWNIGGIVITSSYLWPNVCDHLPKELVSVPPSRISSPGIVWRA
ncbi:MAG: hypothetical protein KatS3mg113_0567 [Planctomycetaceae bacterium]|nr:MAG: hypothetical protein KatS3mg113_0567 [Planctomycetaceae bacterium]